jgi:hypothetical protein
MTTRRTVLRLAGAAPAMALLGACQPDAVAPTATSPPDLLLVETSTGLALVDARDATVVTGPRLAITAWDGSSIVSAATTAAADAGVTRVEVRNGAGALTYHVEVPGALLARVVAPGGGHVALASGSSAGTTPYRPAGRAETTVVVAGPGGERTRLTLPGCVEPEAFTPQGDALYVLDYLPPLRPDRYRVRVVDLTTRGMRPLLTRDKQLIPAGAEEEVRGEGRQAVYATGRTTLFTLYTHQPDHEHTRDLIGGGARDGEPQVHAFVHSLNLNQGFAYCIDLPAPFGEGAAAGHAIALSSVEHPFVVDATSGTIARLDGESLTVAKTAKSLPGGADRASAVVSADGARLFVGTGNTVSIVDTTTLSTQAQWTVAAPVRGLAVSRDGARLWVGQPNAAQALDTSSGRELTTLPIPTLTALAHTNPAP